MGTTVPKQVGTIVPKQIGTIVPPWKLWCLQLILCNFVFFELDLNTVLNLVVLDLGTIPCNVDIVNIVEERRGHGDIETHQDRIHVNQRLGHVQFTQWLN